MKADALNQIARRPATAVGFLHRLDGRTAGPIDGGVSLLADIEYTDGWAQAAPEARLSVQLAGAITADVFKRIVAAQPETGLKAEVEAMLAKWT
ncbi:MAG: hypothetical protein ACT4QE_22775 [Anaerolineales bacterium]